MSKSKTNPFLELLYSLHNHITIINGSKIFAGFMIILLNISSRFVSIKLSKTMESYLRHSFSKHLLAFTVAWMGTRDIYSATIITVIFVIFVEFFFNEESHLCCLPETFTTEHLKKLEENKGSVITPEDVKKAKELLEKAKTQGLA
jgi:hypothetical protein